MNRIEDVFRRLKRNRQKAFVAYITAGDPTLKKTVDLTLALEQAGADIVELGVPFSDPLADGVVNQLAAQRALDSGATLKGVLKAVAAIRKRSQIPIVFFTYYNPIFHFGLKRFLIEAETAGGDGVLILDLPPEAAAREWQSVSTLKRIHLVAPTTPSERMAAIAANGSGFIYYVSREGVTGMQRRLDAHVPAQVSALRARTKLPICVGFGISNPQQARAAATMADGVVVGSAIVNQVAHYGKSKDLAKKIVRFVQPLAQAVKRAP